ncbi:MAG: inositol monophosphatase [Candidatus Muirbacterium halophilum]|nr:inositol monophosphatase [Candidatus Muirbacterium halophilum]MCK9474619.1 inositol monophosphatase [Candidatus Muirbacterium halophilum]
MYDFFEQLVKQAGKMALEGFKGEFTTEYKDDVDPVTEWDKKVEKFLIDNIKQKYPEMGIFSEEDENRDLDKKFVAFIDPIDGTVNFSHKLPFFCVSLGIYRNGVAQMGFVYIPVLDEMFSAFRGKGAKLNGKKIQVSKTDKLNRSIIATGFPYDKHKSKENNVDNFSKMIVNVQGIRRMGCAAIDCCFVACGRLDGFWEIKLNPWDTAAGVLIAKEGGAEVTGFNGEDWDLLSGNIVLTNGCIHNKVLKVLSGEIENEKM